MKGLFQREFKFLKIKFVIRVELDTCGFKWRGDDGDVQGAME